MTAARAAAVGDAPLVGALADRVLGGLLLQAVPPYLVDEVIAEADAGERRRRRMPARLAAYFTLALWLWPDDNYNTVVTKLTDSLNWVGHETPTAAGASSASRARDRLGPAPMRMLFRRLTESTHGDDALTPAWRGSAVRYLDSFLIETPDRCGFTHARILVVADAAGGLIDATWAPSAVSSADMANRLLQSCGRAASTGTLVVAGAVDDAVWQYMAGIDVQLVTETPAGTDTKTAGPWLSDGSYLTQLHGRPARIIPNPGGGLATTLTDPIETPAQELATLYALRWRASDLIRHICGRFPAALRSRSDVGVDQEIWALLCLHQALHRTLRQVQIVERGRSDEAS